MPSQKRAVTQQTRANKRSKIEESVLGAIIEAIEKADCGLNEECKAMMVAMVPQSLGVTLDERHKYQAMAVTMIEETFGKIQAKLEVSVADEAQKVAGVEASRSGLVKKVEAAEAVLGQKTTVMDAKKAILAQVTQTMVTAKKAVAEAEAQQRSGDAAMKEVQKDLSLLEAAIAEHFKVLQSGEAPDEAEKHLNAFMPLVKKHLQLDDSLTIAMPGAFKKGKDARGQFDTMVIDELERSTSAKVAEFQAKIASEGPDALKRAAAVKAAEQQLEARTAEQRKVASEFFGTQSDHTSATQTVKEAKGALAGFEPEYKRATEVRDEAQSALEGFVNGPLSSFEGLKVAQKPEEPVAEEPVAKGTEAATADKPQEELSVGGA